MKKIVKLVLASMMMLATMLGVSSQLFAQEETTDLEVVETSNVDQAKDDLQMEAPTEVESTEVKVNESINKLIGNADKTAAPQQAIEPASAETDLAAAKTAAIETVTAQAAATKTEIANIVGLNASANKLLDLLVDNYLEDAIVNIEAATTIEMVNLAVADVELVFATMPLTVASQLTMFNALGTIDDSVVTLTATVESNTVMTPEQKIAVVKYIEMVAVDAIDEMEATGYDETKVDAIVAEAVAEMNRVVTMFTENGGAYAIALANAQTKAYSTIEAEAKRLTDIINANAYIEEDTRSIALANITIATVVSQMNVDYALSITEVEEIVAEVQVWFNELEVASYKDESNGKLYDKANATFLEIQKIKDITSAQIDEAEAKLTAILKTSGDAIHAATSKEEINSIIVAAEKQIQAVYSSYIVVDPTPGPTPGPTPAPTPAPINDNTNQKVLPETGLANSNLMMSVSLLTMGLGLVVVSRKRQSK